MLGPIEPVGPGPVGLPITSALRSSGSGGISGADTARSVGQGVAAGASDASMLIPLQEFMSAMLEGLGLDPEKDKTLQILITLLILLALLESLQGDGTQERQSSANTLGAGGGGSTYVGYVSSSTLSIEYTETTISFGNSSAAGKAFSAPEALGGGGRLDVSA